MSLLPNHKSKFDKKIDLLFGVRFEDLDIGVINTLASSAPKSLLPILAASFDVDIDGLNENEARELIKNAFEIHYYSGTFYSLNKALSALYADAKVKEWFDYAGLPYHFKLELDASKNGVSLQTLKRSDEIINTYKNVRSVYDGASIKATAIVNLKAHSFAFIGEAISVDPYVVSNINQRESFKVGATTQINEIISIPIAAIRVLTR